MAAPHQDEHVYEFLLTKQGAAAALVAAEDPRS
jgi:hypothetical protein